MFVRSAPAAAAIALLLAMPAARAQTDASLETMTPAQKARLAPRRATEQVVAAPLPTVTQGYRPTLTPPNASGMPDPVGTLPVHPAPVGAGAAPSAPLPVPVTQCSAGGCSGADGQRYQNGAAGATVDAAGRTCRQVGATIQCS